MSPDQRAGGETDVLLVAQPPGDCPVNSAAVSVDMLRDAAVRSGFGAEVFPAVEPWCWAGRHGSGLRVSHDYVTRGFEIMGRQAAGPALGMQLASKVFPRACCNLLYLFMSSHTLGLALDRWVRFQALFTTASQARLTFRGDEAELSIGLADGELKSTTDQVEYALGLMWRFIDSLTAGEIAAKEVRLARAGARTGPYEDFFGAPVRAGMPSNVLVFDRQALLTRSVHACLPVFVVMERLVGREVLAALPRSAAARVSKALEKGGPGPAPELEEVAVGLGMSRRTLQRRLTEEGVSFSQLLDAHCRHIALEALECLDLTNEQLAERCGFEETRSFYRAFARWTGTSPDRFRRESPPDLIAAQALRGAGHLHSLARQCS